MAVIDAASKRARRPPAILTWCASHEPRREHGRHLGGRRLMPRPEVVGARCDDGPALGAAEALDADRLEESVGRCTIVHRTPACWKHPGSTLLSVPNGRRPSPRRGRRAYRGRSAERDKIPQGTRESEKTERFQVKTACPVTSGRGSGVERCAKARNPNQH
jgi:hypothetical protein